MAERGPGWSIFEEYTEVGDTLIRGLDHTLMYCTYSEHRVSQYRIATSCVRDKHTKSSLNKESN